MNIDSLLKYAAFIEKFRAVIRLIHVTGEDRDENDLEHSGQMALIAIYVVDAAKLNLNLEKVLLFSLAHDLVEAYAGDVPFHQVGGEAGAQAKHERETAALQRIAAEFPEHPMLATIIAEYEQRESPEAKFVYALDKLLPVLNIYLDNGRSWKRDGVSFEMVRTKDNKISEFPGLLPIWEELTAKLQENHDNLFLK